MLEASPINFESAVQRWMIEDTAKRLDGVFLDDKAEVADFLVDNEGTLDELEQQIDRLWSDLSARVVA